MMLLHLQLLSFTLHVQDCQTVLAQIKHIIKEGAIIRKEYQAPLPLPATCLQTYSL